MPLLRFPARPSTAVKTLVSEGKWEAIAEMVQGGLSPSVMATESLSVLEAFFSHAAKGLLPNSLNQDELFEILVCAAPRHDPSRLTPLSIACVSGRTHWVEFLLEKGHSPHEQGDGHTVLTAVASLGLMSPFQMGRLASISEYGWENRHLGMEQQRCLDLMLDAGADINQHSQRGATPLVLSCLAKNSLLGMFLLSRGADPNHSHEGAPQLFSLKPLEIAIVSHNETLALALMDAGADLLSPSSVKPRRRVSLVEVAAGLGPQGVMQALEERLGAGHPELEKGWWVALEEGNRDAIDWYIRGRIDPYKVEKGGLKTSHVLAREGHYDLLSDFFRRGLPLDQPDHDGNTAWDVLSAYHPELYQKARSQWKGIPGNVVEASFPRPAEQQA